MKNIIKFSLVSLVLTSTVAYASPNNMGHLAGTANCAQFLYEPCNQGTCETIDVKNICDTPYKFWAQAGDDSGESSCLPPGFTDTVIFMADPYASVTNSYQASCTPSVKK